MAWLPPFRNNKKLLGVSLTPEGVGICQIDKNAYPLKIICSEFVHCGNELSTQTQSLAALIEKHHLRKEKAHVILPADSYQLFLLDANEFLDQDINTSARWLVKDLIDYPLEEAVVAAFPVPDNIKRINVVVAHLPYLYRLIDSCHKLKLKIASMSIVELALLNIMNLVIQDGHAYVLLFINNGTSYLQIAYKNALYIMRRLEIDESNLNQASLTLSEEINRSLDYFYQQISQKVPTLINIAIANSEIESEFFAELKKQNPEMELLNLSPALKKHDANENQLVVNLVALGAAVERDHDNGKNS